MTTERLYYHDSHLIDFEARVVGAETLPRGNLAAIVLDRTAFYPIGGGQPSDTGRLGDARVVECVDREAEGVLHIVEGPPPGVGETVRGLIDWVRRFDHLQQHTGQHILSQSLVNLYGAETRAFRMTEHHAEVDVEFADSFDDERDERIERAVDLANQIVWEDRPLRTRYVTAEQARGLPLRRKDSGREGELRLIEIEDFDLSACGGTHARRTGEVGLIAVRSWERAKGRLTRLEFVCGRRALIDYRAANDDARQVAALLGVGRAEIAEAVRRLQAEQKISLKRLRAYEVEAATREARALVADAPRRAADNARVVAAELTANLDTEAMKSLAQSLIAARAGEGGGVIALLASAAGETSGDSNEAVTAVRLIFARSADLPDDVSALLREAAAALDGRGGGSASFAQGGGRATHEQLTRTLHTLRDRLLTAS